MSAPSTRRSFVALIASNVLGGVGVASGIAVGSLLVVSLSSVAFAGLGQALSVFGAGLMAVPLAGLAARRGRRPALALGYGVALLGAAVIILGAALGCLPVLFAGLLAFGAAQATNLQTRYAASELAGPERRGTWMSMVLWATTIGSVAGPNLSAAGGQLGSAVGLPALAGPYLYSLAAFAAAAAAVLLLFARRPAPAATQETSAAPISALAALGWSARHPVARFAVALIVVAHAVMVGIMSMTPVHLGDGGHGLGVIGLVISLHILGMYALSPVFGALADRSGPMRTALVGLVTLGASAALAFLARDSLLAIIFALVLLGLGWSASIISGSVLLADVDSGAVRVPLQGATDALMSYGGAASAMTAGVLLAAIGYGGLALVAGALIVPACALGWVANRSRRVPSRGASAGEPHVRS